MFDELVGTLLAVLAVVCVAVPVIDVTVLNVNERRRVATVIRMLCRRGARRFTVPAVWSFLKPFTYRSTYFSFLISLFSLSFVIFVQIKIFDFDYISIWRDISEEDFLRCTIFFCTPVYLKYFCGLAII